MPNPITGDFQAVVQISGSTVNRLLATMHQNSWSNLKLPSFPHSASLRIGTSSGIRGNAKVQMGVPRVELIHGVSDRFRLSLHVRARFTSDSGSDHLPEYIKGEVSAEYRLVDIDPSCAGWKSIAADYLWVRAVRRSVKFNGTAVDDTSGFSIVPADPDEVQHNVTKQIATLLATQFEAAPHPVSKRFRRGALRSLNSAAGSAIAFPMGISGEPVGVIDSIDAVVLGGEDLALGLSKDAILGLSQPLIDQVNAYRPTVNVHVATPWPAPDIDTVYRVRVAVTGVQWLPQGSHAVIRVVAHGSADTNSALPNATFDVQQDVVLGFDGEGLVLSAGPRTVKTKSSGLGSGEVAKAVNRAVHQAMAGIVTNLCNEATATLAGLSKHLSELTDQLRTMDEKADAWFESAEFTPDGVIMRGRIVATARKPAVVKFDKTLEEDGFTALYSWIPGGRVDRFNWTWSWYNGGGTSGGATHRDRFVLRRPRRYPRSKWGMLVGLPESERLPGLDGMGSLCLTIEGVRVDHVTGELAPYRSKVRCSRYGFPITLLAGSSPVWPIYHIEPDLPTGPQPVELGLIDVSLPLTSEANAANTLLLYAGGGHWHRKLETTLREALQYCRRNDATLQVIAVFPEGTLSVDLANNIQALSPSLGAPILVTQDVNGAWAHAYSVPGRGDVSWRLLRPAGGVTWMHEGELAGESLSVVLNDCLIPGTPTRYASLDTPLWSGEQLGASALYLGIGDLVTAGSHCPPLPIGRLGKRSVLTFIQPWSSSSRNELRKLAGRQVDEAKDTVFLAVAEGLDQEQARNLQDELGLQLTVLPDPRGAIRRRLGVRQWPTTLSIDAEGRVTDLTFEHLSRRPQQQRPEETGV